MHSRANPSDNIYSTVSTGNNMGDSAGNEVGTDISLERVPGLIPPGNLLSTRASWLKWYAALKRILPIYIGIHLAIFVMSCLAFLFMILSLQA